MRIQQVVIAVIKKDNQILLTKRVQIDPEDIDFAPFVWNLPGGGMESYENAEVSLRREIKEELGVDIGNCFLVPKTFTETRKNWQGVFTVFVCNLKDYRQEITLNEEAGEYGWFTLDEVKKLKTLPQTVDIIVEANKIRF